MTITTTYGARIPFDMGITEVTTEHGTYVVDVGQSMTALGEVPPNTPDGRSDLWRLVAGSVRIPIAHVGEGVCVQVCLGYGTPDPRAGQWLNLGRVLSFDDGVPDPYSAPEAQR